MAGRNKADDKTMDPADTDAGEATGTKVELITVRSTRDDNRTAFFEQHKHHPNGEVFVYGDKLVRVAKTSEVIRALNDRKIVEVEE